MKITVLADQGENCSFHTEFGLSLLLEMPSGKILMDTGAGAAMLQNLKKLGIPPESLQTLVLSHGHADHTGGVPSPREVWCGPGIAEGHFSRHEDGGIHKGTSKNSFRQLAATGESLQGVTFRLLPLWVAASKSHFASFSPLSRKSIRLNF